MFVHLCYVFICVHARICNRGLYIYFPRSLPRAGREGGGGRGAGPADNDVSPARNATLKGAAQDADPKSEEFELVIIYYCSG